jgi:hypothetical protein
MTNADRTADILDALASDRFSSGVTFLTLFEWLGQPYFFERNLEALLAEGRIERVDIPQKDGPFIVHRIEYRLAR